MVDMISVPVVSVGLDPSTGRVEEARVVAQAILC